MQSLVPCPWIGSHDARVDLISIHRMRIRQPPWAPQPIRHRYSELRGKAKGALEVADGTLRGQEVRLDFPCVD